MLFLKASAVLVLAALAVPQVVPKTPEERLDILERRVRAGDDERAQLEVLLNKKDRDISALEGDVRKLESRVQKLEQELRR